MAFLVNRNQEDTFTYVFIVKEFIVEALYRLRDKKYKLHNYRYLKIGTLCAISFVYRAISYVDGPLSDHYFVFTDVNTTKNITQYANTSGLVPVNGFTDKNNPGDFVLSGGNVCFDVKGSIVACDGHQVVTLPHNLDSKEVAYAIYSPEMNDNLDLWLNCGYDVLYRCATQRAGQRT